VFRAEVAPALELNLELALKSALCVGLAEVHLFLCVSSVSTDSLRRHVGKQGIRACGVEEALLGVFVSQPSPVHDQETQHPATSLLGPPPVVS